MACTCNVGPGRYEAEGALTFFAHEAVAMGYSDESIGRYDFLAAPLAWLAEDTDAVKAAGEYGFCAECIADVARFDGYGIAVWSTDQGFAECATYATQAEYDAAKQEAEAEDAEENADDMDACAD